MVQINTSKMSNNKTDRGFARVTTSHHELPVTRKELSLQLLLFLASNSWILT